MGKKIIFGAGKFGRKAVEYYGIENVKFFIDNDKRIIGTKINEIEVLSVECVDDISEEHQIIVASKYYKQMIEQLKERGIRNYGLYLPELMPVLDLVIKTIRKTSDKIVLVGYDETTKVLLQELCGVNLLNRIYGIVDSEKENIGKNVGHGLIIQKIDNDKNEGFLYIVTTRDEHMIARAYIMQKNLKVLDPYQKQGYYPPEDLIRNPYSSEKGAVTEQDWNNIMINNATRDLVNKFVNVSKDDVPLFQYIEIETINRCNGTCSFCPVNAKIDPREKKMMDETLFRSIIDQLAELNYSGELCTFSNNEPLLDKRIYDFNRYAREKLPNARIHLFTNGTLLTIDRFLQLIDSLDELIIDNYNQDLQLIKPCEDLVAYIEKHPEYRNKTTIVLRKQEEILTSRGGDAPNRTDIISFGKDSCALPFEQMVIRPDGKVSLCCNDPLGKITLGDLNTERIIDIWFGEKYKKIREKVANGRENLEHCRYCDTFYIY